MDIAGLKVDTVSKAALLESIERRIFAGEKSFVITPYSEFLYEGLTRPKTLEVFNRANFSVPDGIGMFWAAAFLDIPLTAKTYHGRIFQALWQAAYTLAAIVFHPTRIKKYFPEKIVGADLVWDLAKLAEKNKWSVYLLGGFGNTPEVVAQKLKTKNPKLIIAGVSNKNPNNPTIIDDINRANPDMLFVAFGPVRQEHWIAENLDRLNSRLAIGLGGTFDYIAGKRLPPPKFVRLIGLEWAYRLITQPYRIKRIYNATAGLIKALVRYKIFMSLPLRSNAVAVILNRENEVLVCERNPYDFYIDIIDDGESIKKAGYWQLPQGGIEAGEDTLTAARREAAEETGIKNLELLMISEKTNTYIWNNALRKLWKNRAHRNQGQTQSIVYFRFLGSNEEVKAQGPEFVGHKWIKINELENVVHPERISLTKIVQMDLSDMANKAII